MKSCIRKYFILVALMSILCDTSAHPITASGDDTDPIKRIVIASEPDYPPFCYINKDDNADGFSIELFKAAAKAMNIEVEIKIGIWNVIKQDLAQGKIDALPLVGMTREREELYDFTFPYLSLHGAVFVRIRDSGIKTLEDLEDKKIIVMKGDNAAEFVYRRKISNNVIETFTYSEAFQKLASGEGDAVITQRIMGIQLLKSLKIRSVKPLDIPLHEFRQDFCFAVQKGNTALQSQLNEGLSIIIANETYNEIYLKWLGHESERHLSREQLIATVLYILIPFVLIFSFFSIIFLRREVKRRTQSLHIEIADHKRTVMSLHNQQSLLAEMEKVTKVGGWEYDVINEKVVWTDGVYNIYEVPRYEFDPSIKHVDMEFYHPEDRKILDEAFRNTLNEGNPYDLVLRLNAAGGTVKWVRTAGQAVIRNGEVIRVYGNIIDITEQKHVEDELRRLKEDLERIVAERTSELEEKVQMLKKSEKAMLYMVEDLNKMTAELRNEKLKLEATNKELEAFSYSVSHDLRAPLRVISGFTEIILERYSSSLDAEGIRLYSVIAASAKRMGILIEELLSFSRFGRQEIKHSKIDMHALVNAVYQEYSKERDKKNITFILQDIPEAYGDLSMIRQVWVNLIDNAIKFSSGKPDRIIEVGSKTDGAGNIYYIKDNGTGFDMAYSEKIFEVFQRLHSSKEFEGTGLGLAIVQRILERMNGRIWAEGIINEGATFYFLLPDTISK
jgi:signal transduction histidine kinase/ABC-type amino acid transport substrate-binding protein